MAKTKRSKGKGIDGSYRFLEYTIDRNQPVLKMLLKVDDTLRRFDKIRTTSPAFRAIETAVAAATAAFLECLFGVSGPKVSVSPPRGIRWPPQKARRTRTRPKRTKR